MKKLISLVLALVMALSLTTVAWGATTHPVTSFAELKTALTNAVDGDTIDVTATVEINENIDIDLTGLTVTNNVADGHMFSIVFPATEVTITGGTLTIPAGNTTSHGFVDINTAAKVVINGGTYSGNLVDDPTNASGLKYVSFFTNPAAGVELELKGVTATSNRLLVYADQYFKTLTVTGGAYTSDFAAFAVGAEAAGVNVRFSDVTATASGSIVVDVVGAGANNTKAVFTNCTITSSKVVAGDSNDFKSTALAASYGAEVTIDGGTYTAKGEAITVSESGGTIIVKGGTFNSEEAIGLPNDKGSYGSFGTNSTIEIQGGTFNGPMTTPTTANESLAISGGTFSDDVSEYVAPGKQLLANGTVVTTPAAGTPAPTLYVWDNAGAEWDAYFIATGDDLDDLKRDASDNCLPCYEINNEYFVEVKEAAATFKLVYGNAKVFLAPVDASDVCYEAKASVLKVVAAEDVDCGEYYVADAIYDEDDVYYASYDKKGEVTGIYVAAKNGSEQILVNGKIVDVEDADSDVDFKFHEFKGYDVVNKQYTTVKCENCPKVAKLYANATAATVGKKAPEKIGTLGWITFADYMDFGANAPVVGGTVESAKTFDAGIAMYVGMSVMAAAGSAVVLKKKD